MATFISTFFLAVVATRTTTEAKFIIRRRVFERGLRHLSLVVENFTAFAFLLEYKWKDFLMSVIALTREFDARFEHIQSYR